MIESRLKKQLQRILVKPLIAVIIVTITFLTFFPIVHAFFVDDDFLLLSFAQNPRLELTDFFSPYLGMPIGVFFRPLTLAFFVGLHSIFGIHATYYHVVSLLLHCLNAFLIYILADSIFGRARSKFVPLFASLIFAIHPRAIDVVALINSLPDALCCMFMLTSLILYAHQFNHKSQVLVFYSGLALALALGSKEVAVIMPLLVVLVWLGQPSETRKSNLLKEQMLLTITLDIVYFAVRYFSVHQIGIGKSGSANYTLVHLGGFFLKGIIAFFLPAQLLSDASKDSFGTAFFILAFIVIVLVICAYFLVTRRGPHSLALVLPLVTIACGLVCLAPASFYGLGLKTIQENRFIYLPIAFFSISLVCFADILFKRTTLLAFLLTGYVFALSVASRIEISAVGRMEAVTESLFNNIKQFRTTLLTASKVVILGSPRVSGGVPIGLPKEGIAIAISIADSTRYAEPPEEWLSGFIHKVSIIGETSVDDSVDGFPVAWKLSDDTLSGTMKSNHNFFIHQTDSDTKENREPKVGFFEQDKLRRTFQRISIFPVSGFPKGTLFLNCGFGKIMPLRLKATNF